MATKVELQVVVSKNEAVAGLRSFRGEVASTFGDILAQSKRLDAGLGKIAFNPDGIAFGVKSALGDLGELNTALKETRENLKGLSSLKVNLLPKNGLGGLREETEKTVNLTTGLFQRQVEQQKRLDDSLMASRYRNLQVSGAQYRQYLTQRLGEENTSVQQSIRLNNELADLQIDAMKRVTVALREEEQKRARETRQNARIGGGSVMVQRGTGLSAVGNGLRNAGQAMTWGYSAPVAGAVGYSVNKAIDYEADFANVKKTVGGSDAELKALRTDLEALSTQVPESFKTITDIASTVGQLGVARGEVKNVTRDIIQLHVATKLSTDTGTMQMVKFANAIGEPAKNIGRLGSVISELDKDSKATSNEVLSMALRIGGVGHEAGLSGPQILAFANAFAGVGVRAQQGGSAISTAIIQIDRAATTGGTRLAQFANVAGMTSDQFRKAFKENAAGALAAFIEGLGRLRDSHTDLVPVMDALGLKGKLETDALLRASGAGSDLSKALGRVDQAYQSNTATGERYARATDNTQASLTKLRNETDLVAVKLGTDLMPTIKQLIPDVETFLREVTRLIDDFERLPQPVRNGVLELLALSVAAGPVITGFGNILTIVGSVTRGLGYLKGLRAAKVLTDIADGAETAGGKLVAADTAATGLGARLALLSKGAVIPITLAIIGATAAGNWIKDHIQKDILDPTYAANDADNALPMSAQMTAERDGDKDDLRALQRLRAARLAQKTGGAIPQGAPDAEETARLQQTYGIPGGSLNRPGAGLAEIDATIAKLGRSLSALDRMIPRQAAIDKAQRLGTGTAAAGAPAYIKAMMGDSGKVIGLECGEAISHYLGRPGAATRLDTAANAVTPNAQGQYPEGTIFRVGRRFHGEKDGEDKYTRGHYGGLHYGAGGPVWVEANYGIKKGVTDTRPFDLKNDVREATWGGRVHAYLPPGVPRVYPSAPTPESGTPGGAAPGRSSFNPSLFGNQKNADAQADLRKRLYEATHGEYQNRRFEAYQAFKDDKGTDPAKAKLLLLATLKQIDKDEAAEHKKQEEELARHHTEVEARVQAHLKRLQALQAPSQAVIRAAQKRDATAAGARAQIAGHVAALEDPDAYAYDTERGGAHAKYDARIGALGGGKTLGPYSLQQLRDFKAAKQELDASLADIAERQGQKAKDRAAQDAEEVAGYQKQAASETAELNREVWQHAGGDMTAYFDALRREADEALAEVQAKYGAGGKNLNAAAVAAAQGVHDARYAVIGQQQVDDARSAQEKIDEAQRESVRFEYEQHLISLGQYQDYLRRKLALTKQYETPEDQKNGVLSRDWMQAKGELDASEGEKKAGPPRAQLVGGQPFWDGLADSASEQGSRVMDALFNPKEKKGIWKSMWQDFKQSAEEELKGGLKSILKNLLTGGGTGSGGLFGGLLGGLFGRGKAGASGAGGAGGGLPLDIASRVLGNGGVAIPMSQGVGGTFSPQGIYSAAGGLGLGDGMGGLSGMGSDPGMGGGGLSSGLGLLSMLGKGGAGSLSGGMWKAGGLFAKGGLFTGGGALGSLGAAMPWIGAGLALNSLLGNPLKKLFRGLHFADGGRPPVGVPSLVGERGPELFVPSAPGHIFTAAQTRAMTGAGDVSPKGAVRPGGDTHITVIDNGDKHLHTEADFDRYASKLAKKMQTQRRAGIPANF